MTIRKMIADIGKDRGWPQSFIEFKTEVVARTYPYHIDSETAGSKEALYDCIVSIEKWHPMARLHARLIKNERLSV